MTTAPPSRPNSAEYAVGQYAELGDCVQRRLDGEGAAFVYILVVAIVVRAVEDVVVLVLRDAVGGEGSAGRIAWAGWSRVIDADGQYCQAIEVAVADRQVVL